MSDTSLFFIGVAVATAVTGAILNMVYQIYLMADRDENAVEKQLQEYIHSHINLPEPK